MRWEGEEQGGKMEESEKVVEQSHWVRGLNLDDKIYGNYSYQSMCSSSIKR